MRQELSLCNPAKDAKIHRMLCRWLAPLIILISARGGSAQVVPFFGGGTTAFDPQIGVVNSGVVDDVQAVVSADRKYVTLNMRPTLSTLIELRNFTFQQPGQVNVIQGGFVGGIGNGSILART